MSVTHVKRIKYKNKNKCWPCQLYKIYINYLIPVIVKCSCHNLFVKMYEASRLKRCVAIYKIKEF